MHVSTWKNLILSQFLDNAQTTQPKPTTRSAISALQFQKQPKSRLTSAADVANAGLTDDIYDMLISHSQTCRISTPMCKARDALSLTNNATANLSTTYLFIP